MASQTGLVVSKLWVSQADRDNRALCPSSSRLVRAGVRFQKSEERGQKHNVSVLLDFPLYHVSMILWSKAVTWPSLTRVGETDSAS